MRMSASAAKAIGFTLVVAGLASVGVALVIKRHSGPTEGDYVASEVPAYRAALDSLARRGICSFAFTVPRNAQWERILTSWGDPGFMVFAAANARTIYRFSSLEIDVRITKDGRRQTVEQVVFLPYMRALTPNPLKMLDRSSGQLPDTGVVFRAAPGDTVQVEIVARSPTSLPTGELIVKREWSLGQKDHLVVPATERLLFAALVTSGITCLGAAGAVAALFRRGPRVRST